MRAVRKSRRAVPEFSRIAPDVKLGKDVKIFRFVNLYGCSIGDGSRIGADLFRLFGNVDGWVAFLDQCAALRLIFNALNLGKVSDQVRAPVSIADHSDFHSIKALG